MFLLSSAEIGRLSNSQLFVNLQNLTLKSVHCIEFVVLAHKPIVLILLGEPSKMKMCKIVEKVPKGEGDQHKKANSLQFKM